MKMLVTAGNTQVYIDKVRCLTNIFTGRTGAAIALAAHQRGHDVTLLTSHPEVVAELSEGKTTLNERWQVRKYQTFAELQTALKTQVVEQPPAAVIHSAAVSDYLAAGIYAPYTGTRFQADTGQWHHAGEPPALVDRGADKVKSSEPELWLRLVRAPKLVDALRAEWGYKGILVKFKLEVGISDDDLLKIAEKSRTHSRADFMVANTLEGASTYAYVGPCEGTYLRVSRRELALRLLEQVEQRYVEQGHG